MKVPKIVNGNGELEKPHYIAGAPDSNRKLLNVLHAVFHDLLKKILWENEEQSNHHLVVIL